MATIAKVSLSNKEFLGLPITRIKYHCGFFFCYLDDLKPFSANFTFLERFNSVFSCIISQERATFKSTIFGRNFPATSYRKPPIVA